MSLKTTLVLIFLLVVVAALWLYAPGAPSPTAPSNDELRKPEEIKYAIEPRLDAAAVARATLERPGQPTLAFERAPKPDSPKEMTPWKLVAPMAVPAENAVVQRLVSGAAALESRRRFGESGGGTLAAGDAGLNPPEATLTLVDDKGKEHRIDVGKQAAASTDRYVRVGGAATIHLARGAGFFNDLNKELDAYRSRKLAPFTVDSAVGLTIEHEGKVWELSKGPDGQWAILSPMRAYADAPKVREVLTKISGLQVDSFVGEVTAGAAGLDPPFLRCTVTTEASKPRAATTQPGDTQPAEPLIETVQQKYSFNIGSFADLKSEKRFVQPGDQTWLASVKQSDVERLLPKAEWRDPKITRVKATDVTGIKLTIGDETVALRKNENAWEGTGDLTAVERPAVTDLLQAFEDLTSIGDAPASEDRATLGLDPPRATVEVTAKSQIAPVTLLIGADTASGKNTYVQRVGDPTVFVISAAQARRLAVPPLSLRSRSIMTLGPDQLRRLTLTRHDVHYLLERDEDGAWKLSEPEGAPVDPNAARELALNVARLTAKNVVARDDDARFGLEKPIATIDFVAELPLLRAPQSTQPAEEAGPPPSPPTERFEGRIRVGRMKDVAFGRKDGDPYVFELDDSVFRVFTGELINTALFSFKADEITELAVDAPGGKLELAKQGDRWVYGPDPFVALSQKRVKEFLEELAKLRAESYVRYRGADLSAEGLADAPVTVVIRLTNDREVTLKLAQEAAGQLPRKAALIEEQRVFRIKHGDAEKLLRGLDYYAKSDNSEKEDTAPPAPLGRGADDE